MKKFWNLIKRAFSIIFLSNWYMWVTLILSIIIGMIWTVEIGAIAFFSIAIIIILFIYLRLLYVWIKKKNKN